MYRRIIRVDQLGHNYARTSMNIYITGRYSRNLEINRTKSNR